nr:MAG TPA: hypothetical protein [Caudoviricetes sp.]
MDKKHDKIDMEMLNVPCGSVIMEFEKDGKEYKAEIIRIPIKYFLITDMLDGFMKKIIEDLYKQGWDFSKAIDFTEIVNED